MMELILNKSIRELTIQHTYIHISYEPYTYSYSPPFPMDFLKRNNFFGMTVGNPDILEPVMENLSTIVHTLVRVPFGTDDTPAALCLRFYHDFISQEEKNSL